jgi:hypothetical protein
VSQKRENRVGYGSNERKQYRKAPSEDSQVFLSSAVRRAEEHRLQP